MKRYIIGAAIGALLAIGGTAAALQDGDGISYSPDHPLVVAECIPDLTRAPITLAACAADGSTQAALPVGRYELIVTGEQSRVCLGAACVASAEYVIGTQKPVTVSAATVARCGSVSALGKVQFQACR